jgi:hypothetical protein
VDLAEEKEKKKVKVRETMVPKDDLASFGR